jgi:c-di-GMP-binding flagellar brake protein YcgR
MKIELTATDEDSRYWLRSKPEVAQVLRGVMHGRELVTAYFGLDDQFMLTTLLEVDPRRDVLRFDLGPDAALNQRMARTGQATFTTALDHVRVQFDTPRIAIVRYEGREAFETGFPEALFKLQRREYYRLVAPAANPLRCLVPAATDNALEARIIDISLGGVGIISYGADAALRVGDLYQGCRIQIPDAGTIMATLQMRSIFDVTLKNGLHSFRAGCQFMDISTQQQAVIQRYILQVERERRARGVA